MTDNDDAGDLAARARQAFETTVQDAIADAPSPTDPATLAKQEQAVRSLRRLDREVFLARRLDAMSYAEIAARTGLTVRQVERRIAHALRELDAFMRDQPISRHRWWPF